MTSRLSKPSYPLSLIFLGVFAGCGTGQDNDDTNATSSLLEGAPIVGLAGKCLTVSLAETDNGTPVQLDTCDGTSAQRWTYQNGTLVGIAGKCLDVRWGGTANGTPLQIYDCNNTPAQKWTFTNGELVGLAGKCADVAGANSADGTPVQLWDCTGAPNQLWKMGGPSAADAGVVDATTGDSGAGTQFWAGILSPSRATDWTKSGVQGGIPSGSWKQCGATIAAYGSSGSYASPSAITTALSSNSGRNCYVLLGNGDFYLNAAIQSSGVSNVELRGGGPQNTRIHFSSGSTCAGGRGSCLIGFQSSDGTYGSSTVPYASWTGGHAQGATSITLASGSNLAVGTMLVLDQCDDGHTGHSCTGASLDNGDYFNCQDKYGQGGAGYGCSENGSENQARPSRGQQEMAQVVSCSPACGTNAPTTVTLSRPLIHPNWRSGQTPEVWQIQPAQYVGINGVAIDGSGFSYGSLTFGIGVNNLANFWITNVRLTNFANTSIYAAQSTNGDIESNYIYGIGQFNNTNDSSGINYLLDNTRIQNNIIQGGKVGIIPTGPGSGNVIAYNVALNAYTADAYDFSDIWTGHSNGSDYNLYEGNDTNYLTWDQTHGTQLMITAYRNFFTGFESCANGNCGSSTVKQNNNAAIADNSFNRYANIVANVLGTPGVSTLGYTYSAAGGTFFNGSGLGYAYSLAAGNNGIPNVIPLDPHLLGTTLRWGNWDAFNSSTQWNTGEVPGGISVYPNSVPTGCASGQSCPPSFYLSSRPAWWPSSVPFPAIGPDVSGGNVGQCTGNPGTAGQYAGVAATNGSQCKGASLAGAWAGHVHATPAMHCFLDVMSGAPDGTGSVSVFDPMSCYGAGL